MYDRHRTQNASQARQKIVAPRKGRSKTLPSEEQTERAKTAEYLSSREPCGQTEETVMFQHTPEDPPGATIVGSDRNRLVRIPAGSDPLHVDP